MKERLKNIIQISGLSQKDFANAIGVSPSRLTEIFSGRTKSLSADALKAIVNEFNININWLLTGEGEMFLPEKNHPSYTRIQHDGNSSVIKTDNNNQNFGVIDGNVETYPDITLVEQISRTGWFQGLTGDKKFIIAGIDEIQDADFISDIKGSISLKVRTDRMKKVVERNDQDKPLRQKGEAG